MPKFDSRDPLRNLNETLLGPRSLAEIAAGQTPSRLLKDLTGPRDISDMISSVAKPLGSTSILDQLYEGLRGSVLESASRRSATDIAEGLVSAGDRHRSLLKSVRGPVLPIDTFGAAARAAETIRTSILGRSVYGDLVSRAASSAMAVPSFRDQLDRMVATSMPWREFHHGALCSLTPTGLGAKARTGKWMAELPTGTLAAKAASVQPRDQSTSVLEALTRRSTNDWRIVTDGVFGPRLAGARPAMVGGYAALHRSLLELATMPAGIADTWRKPPFAGHAADHLAGLAETLRGLQTPLEQLMRESRAGSGAQLGTAVDFAEFAALADVISAELTTAPSDGLADRLLRLLERILRKILANTRREVGEAGILTALTYYVAITQIIYWIDPDLAPTASPAPPSIEEQADAESLRRLKQSGEEMQREIRRLGEMLANQEAENVAVLPRALIRRTAVVRAGPSSNFGARARLQQGDVVAYRERDGDWCLVFFRDELTGTLDSGWVAVRHLAELGEADAE